MDQVGNAVHPSFELLSAYHDAEASPAEVARVSAHLDRCTACRRQLAGFDLLSMALAGAPALGCAAARPLLSAQLDGETSRDEAAIATAHLASCASCRETRASWQTLDLALAALPSGVPSAAADAKIRGLAHRPRRILPTGPVLGGGVLGRVTAAAVALVLALIASLPPGVAIAPPVATGEERPLVASVQQVLNPLTNTLYVLQPGQGVVVAKNATTNVELAQISVGGKPTALALNAAANVVYVLDPSAKTYTTISGETNTVTATASVPLSGTLTSIQVNQSTGQLVIGAAAAAAPSAAPGQLAIIDPASQKHETRSVDVAPIQVVLELAGNRLFLLGAKSTSVINAKTYEVIATLAPAVSAAASTTGGATAILTNEGGRAQLSFYGTTTHAAFDGAAVNVVSLPDGAFAILLDRNGAGQIGLVAADGTTLGALDLTRSTKSLTFDSGTRRFLGSTGEVVATIVGTTIAAAPTPPVAAKPSPTEPATAAPASSSAPSVPARPEAGISLPLPQPTSGPGHVPGALVAAKHVERVDLGANAARAITSSGARIWFVDDGGILFAVDSDTGVVTKFAATGLVSKSTLITASATSVYLADPASGRIAVVDVSSGIARTADAPFGDSITGMAIGPSGHLWLVASRYAGLIDFDPASRGFALIAVSKDARPSAVAVDLAGRVWFADGARHTVGFYESTFGRITERPVPTRSAVTSAVADRTGQVWFSTADGYVFTAAATEAGVARRVAGSVAELASGGGSVWFVSGDSPALVGSPTGDLRVILSSGARSLAVDSRGRAWVADPSAHALFVVNRD